jgi:thiamine pyrophosphate-dependent acetolactate synthase large subunit-like protein
VPADVANAASHDEPPYAVHARHPVIRPSDPDLDEIATILNKSEAITIYGQVPAARVTEQPRFGWCATSTPAANAKAARAISISKAGELDGSIRAWLAHPGLALLHVKVSPMQLVMPLSPLVAPEAVVGMGVYTAKAMLQGKGRDVWEMMVENVS